MAAAAALPTPQPTAIYNRYMPHKTSYQNNNNQTHTCPKCGTPVPGEENRIAELEAQVRILTDKATAAADKLADYEDEVRRLRNTTHQPVLSRTQTNDSLSPSRPSTEDSPARPTTSSSTTKPSRFSFLSSRLTTTPSTPPPVPAPSDTKLAAALQTEKLLRQQAEGKLQSMNIEIEELSATLFSQANEMVANERKARAKLEERVAVLEHRDEEKRRRLERLEGAMRRLERVKGLLVGM